PGGKETKDFLELLTEYTATMRLSPRARGARGHGFIATGGNIEALTRIAGADQETAGGTGVPRITRGELRKVILELSHMTVSERMRAFDLRPDRADVILPAAVVYLHLATVFEAEEILTPGGGIREGIVLDLAEKLDHHRAPREEGALDDAVSLGRKYSFDEAHSVHVARLAEQLFDQLTQIHGLAVRDRLLLVAAAILHDIGDFVSLKGHHKHSLYLISRAELSGLSAREMFLVGNIARYHRKSAPSIHHAEFALLSAADRERVRRLAAILRVADALDKEHREKIRRVQVRNRDGRVEILAGTDGDLVLERWALEKKSDLFRRVFGVEVVLVGQEADGNA
ncbi:MAG TPA: HD domain-containing protein, partial [Spirochaetia bacterium]|nr:HD domain-containing protein [Spirochaetia bacterium]